jgi:restriction system protein
MTRYWVIAPFESNLPMFERVWQFDLANGVISIGWHELGDVSSLTKDELRTKYEEKFGSTNPGTVTKTVNMLCNFFHEIKEGDIVLARKGTKKLAAVGTVKGDAYFSLTKNPDLAVESPDNFHTNFLDVQWHDSPRDKEYDNRIPFGIQALYEIGEAEYKGLIGDDITEAEEAAEDIENRPQFFLEKYLEQFIVDNFDSVFGNRLALLRDTQGNVVGQQYRTDVGPIDILAFERNTNSFVVIELKKGRESDKVVGQTLRYIGWVGEELCKNDEKVTGMIICLEPDDKLYYAVKATQNLELKYYHIDFKLSDSI